MHSKTVKYSRVSTDGWALTYRQHGHGPNVWLAFHGIGQTGAVFDVALPRLGPNARVLSVDLPFHGESATLPQPTEPLTPEVWQKLLETLLAQEGISRFSVLGFSLGGRFALLTTYQFAERIDTLTLLAPDGITRSGWYETATSTAAGRGLFRYVLQHLPLLHRLGITLVKAGLLNKSLLRFAENTLATPKQREQVFQSWVAFRRIRTNLKRLAQRVTANNVAVNVVIGQHDRILPATFVQPLLDALPNVALDILPTGHNRLVEVWAKTG